MFASRRNVAVTVLCLAVLVTACPVAQSPTEIVRFDADVVSIQRGQVVRLSCDVRNPGSDASVPSCSITLRFEGADPETPFRVACSGAFDDVPAPPSGAGYVRYQLNALKQPRDAVDAYVTAVVTVVFLDPAPTVSVSVIPDAVTLVPNALQSFTASVTGTANTGVTWNASCGAVTGSGNEVAYVAPRPWEAAPSRRPAPWTRPRATTLP